jgi:hypothetical protein
VRLIRRPGVKRQPAAPAPSPPGGRTPPWRGRRGPGSACGHPREVGDFPDRHPRLEHPGDHGVSHRMGCHFRQTGPFAGAGTAMLDRVHLPPGTLDHIRRRGGCLCRYQDGVQFIVDRLRHTLRLLVSISSGILKSSQWSFKSTRSQVSDRIAPLRAPVCRPTSTNSRRCFALQNFSRRSASARVSRRVALRRQF